MKIFFHEDGDSSMQYDEAMEEAHHGRRMFGAGLEEDTSGGLESLLLIVF